VIYLDHAATSWPKPPAVLAAVEQMLTMPTGNVGRSSFDQALKASEILQECRENLAQLIHAPDPLRICFTANATEALNMALKGVLRPGDHAICTSMEHNAVWRPLVALREHNVDFSIAQADAQGVVTAESIAQLIRPNTRLIAVNHASNVNGAIQPIAEIGALAHSRGILFLVDGSQSIGSIPLDVQAMQIDLLGFPGHKALLGPQGTGGLYVGANVDLRPLREGGTGTLSELSSMPHFLPDRLEAGTMNLPGIAGLNQSVLHLLRIGIEEIQRHEQKLLHVLLSGLSEIKNVDLTPAPALRVPTVSFNLRGSDPVFVAEQLDRDRAIACRPGLHCAHLAHQTLGTAPLGTVRFSLGYTSDSEEIASALDALQALQ